MVKKSAPQRLSVKAAVERDLNEIRNRDPALAKSGLAATALALATRIDDPANSATSISMCSRALRETLDRLRELAPEAAEQDRLDDLGARRTERLARGAKTARRKRS